MLRHPHILLATLITATLTSACYLGLDTVAQSEVACDSDSDCVDKTAGEFDSCGTELGEVCCGEGSLKCGCHQDGSCEGELECFFIDEDLVGNYPEGDYCLQGWAGDLLGLDRL